MAKQSKGGVKLDPAFVSEVCVEVYTEELDKDSGYANIGGLPVKERFITDYIAWKKCNREQGEAYFVDCSMIYKESTERILQILTERGELLEPVKKKREVQRRGLFDKEYVYDLTVESYERKLGGRSEWVKAHMKEHGSDKQRANQRFNDFAQNLASSTRSILTVLAIRGQLPKHVYAGKK